MLEPEKGETNKIDSFQEGSVVLKDNRLVFSSGKFVEKYINDLKKNQANAGLTQLYSVDVKGFKSMQEEYNELIKYGIGEAIKDGSIANYKDILEITTDEKGRKDFKVAVRNHLLASIINTKGLIQIGNDVYKIKGGKAYKTQEKDIHELSSLDIKKSGKVSIIAFAVNSKSDKSARVNDSIGEDKSQEYSAFDGAATRRFCTRIDIYRGFWSPSTIYGEFSVRHQRDNWYGWGSIETGPWSFNSGGSITFKYTEAFIGNNGTHNFSTVNHYPQWTDGVFNNMSDAPVGGLENEVTYRAMRVFGSWSAFGNWDDGRAALSYSFDETATW